MKQKRLQYKIAVWLTMGLMVMDPLVVPLAYAENPIEVDRNAPQHRQAQVGQAANGITLVNIAGPTAGGVSRNDYTNFNVPQHGVILNNSYQMANTSLAGYVPGNANMMRGSASVIVNEVTSHNPTNMNGFIEVAGRKASVVVANPNGITVDGGGFINTDRAVLTTGKPEYDPNGNINTYRVEQGSIAINGKGLNAKESNSLQILTEAAQVNAGVWANAVETRTGKNIIDAKSLESKAFGSSNQIGLDVSAIGGMYANSITMKGTNDGLGVNVKGTLSSVHATNISADGMIQVDGGITSNGQTSISGHAISVGQDGVVQGDNDLSIESQSSMTNHGLVNSNGTTDIHAKSVDNAENGRIYGNTVSIKADTVSNHTDATIEARYKSAADVLTQAKEALDKEWNADITAYKTKEELQAHRNRIQELTKTYDKAQEAMTKVQKELDSHKSGTIASRDHMDIQANEIHNNGNALLYSGNTMNLTGSHVIENKGATIQSGGEMTLTTSNLVNDNASFGMKRVSDGITKHGDKLKVDDKNHPEENQIFDVSEFPGYTGKGGYGVAHKVPVKQADGTIIMVDKGVPPVKNFTLIRSEEEHTHTEVTNNQPGVISAGGDIVINGASSNINSKIASAGQVIFNGAHETVSDKTSDKVFKTGTTQVSEAKRVRKAHGYRHKWRRYWDPEVFMTPSIEEQNIQPIGTIQEHAEDTIAEANKHKVNDSLDPFGTGNQGKSSIGNVTIEGLKLPTQAIYNIHPDITANALIETDSAFTNRKKFVSSEYMLNALANDPDRRMKRLGDGFYEQGLINSQILSATGKPYLEGYTDNESEYKALLEAGISYGKKYKLTPGITLSEEQMKAITTDMVWLETKTIVVNGQPQQVLYPKVYLAKQSANQIDAMGAVVSGKSIIANTDSTFKNSGNMMADSIVVQANTVDNTGRFNANTVAIGATDSIRNTGAIHGNDSVILRANNDISVEAATHKLANQDVLMQQGRIGVSNPKGTIDIHSNKDVHLTGAIITGGDEGNISITSANTVNVDTKKLSAKKDMTLNAANYLRTDRGTEIGTQILGDGNVTVAAKNDVNIRQGVINSEHGATTIVAGNDVNIENGNTYSRDQYGLQYKEKGLLSRTVNTIRKDYEHTGVTASTIGGNTIQVGANHDVNVTGSNVLGTGDVAISAGNKVRTNSAEDSSRNDTYQHSKKKGLMGAGLGFTIGSKKITDTYDGRYITQEASNIASTNGVINVTAGDTIHSTTTNYFSNSPVSLTATDVDIDGKHNSSHVVQTHEEKRSGLTVSVGGQVVSALNTAQQLSKRANSRKTSALSAFEYGEAANSIKHAYNDAKVYSKIKPVNLLDKEREVLSKANELNKSYQLEHPEIENAVHPDVQNAIDKEQKYKQEQARKDRLLNINVSIGSSKYKQRNELNEEQYIGSSIGSKTKVDITANSNDMSKGNIHITGSTVEAPVVNVSASNNLRMDAGTNTVVQRDDYTSSGWSIGATVSPHGSGVIGLDANVYKGKENALETTKTHTGTVILGKQVNTVSGNNTEIIGSKVIGESVTTKVGHDLHIESLQDTNDYHKISKNKSISVSYGMSGPARVGFENSRGSTDSHYASVTDQAGIYAGDGGYNVQVNHATTLTGGIIKGSPDKSKNRLSSNSLKMNDIQNEASYSAKTSGYSLSTTKRTKNNPIGITGSPKMGIPVKGSAKSTTHSAISEGVIEIAEKESLEKINHDTEQALNKLAPIFDKKTVEEKQILLNKISDHGYKLIGDIALHQQRELYDKANKAKIAGNKAKYDYYIKEAKKWGDNGPYKIALHTGLGGVISSYSGHTFSEGSKAASINEVLQSSMKNIVDSDLRKIMSIVIGRSVSDEIGSSIALSATENNWLNHYDQMAILNLVNRGRSSWESLGWSQLAYFVALDERTSESAANALGIDESIDGTVVLLKRYISLPQYFEAQGVDTSKGLSYALRDLARVRGYNMEDFEGSVSYYKSKMDDSYMKFHYPDLSSDASEQFKSYSTNMIETVFNGGPSSLKSSYYRDSDGQLVKEFINGDIEETGIYKGVENMNSQVPLEYTGSYYLSGNNYVPTDNVPENIRTIVSQGFYSENDSRLGLQLIRIGGVDYIQDKKSQIILKVAPDFIVNTQNLNSMVKSDILRDIESRGYINESDLNRVETIRENGKTYIVDKENGERIIANLGMLLKSQGMSRYDIANDRFKRIGTNKKVGLSGGIPVYGALALVGSVSEQKNSNGDIVRIYEGGASIGVPIKIKGMNITQPISGNGLDLGVTNSYSEDIEAGKVSGVISGNTLLASNQWSFDSDTFTPSYTEVNGLNIINPSVDGKVRYTEKLEPVVDSISKNSIKNNFGELSSFSKKSLGVYNMNPRIGSRYVHKLSKDIFIIRTVDSPTHKYEFMDEFGDWKPLKQSDFETNYTSYKG